jgi:hypothetical protein
MEARGPLDALNAIALTSTAQRRTEAMLRGAEEAEEGAEEVFRRRYFRGTL